MEELIERNIKEIESITGSLSWTYTVENKEYLISIVAKDLSEEQDDSLANLHIFGEDRVSDGVIVYTHSDYRHLSFDIKVDPAIISSEQSLSIIETIRSRY